MSNFLNQGWVGSVIGLIGICAGFFFFRKSLRLPDPRVTFKSDHVLTWGGKNELPSGIQIRFHDEQVPRIARSVVRIWNAGSGCLTKDHISEHDNLRFVLANGGKFLDAVLIKESNSS